MSVSEQVYENISMLAKYLILIQNDLHHITYDLKCLTLILY